MPASSSCRAYTSASSRGRFPIQETTRGTLPPSLYESGRPFHFARIVDDPAQLAEIERALAAGLDAPQRVRRSPGARHGGAARTGDHDRAPAGAGARRPRDAVRATRCAACIDALNDGPFAIWVGYGARDAAAESRDARAPHARTGHVLAARQGNLPEDDPLFVGVTGLAGHASVMRYLEEWRPRRVLVLGSRLGESTSFWDRTLHHAPEGFVHVDVDPDVPGAAFARRAHARRSSRTSARRCGRCFRPVPAAMAARCESCRIRGSTPVIRRREGLVQPEALMDALQDWVVDGSNATVLAESGHSFLWTTHRLRFVQPHRYRISNSFGSMGHAAAGVVGAALATGRRAVAVVGDGAHAHDQRDQHRGEVQRARGVGRPQRRALRHVRAGHGGARPVGGRRHSPRRLRGVRARAQGAGGARRRRVAARRRAGRRRWRPKGHSSSTSASTRAARRRRRSATPRSPPGSRPSRADLPVGRGPR